MVGECPLGDTALGFEDWAKFRQSISSFLAKDGEDAQLRAKLLDVADIAAILEVQGLRAVRDILGLLEGHLPTLQGLVNAENATLGVMNTYGILLQEVRRAIAEKEILQEIKHPFLIQLHYAFHQGNKIYLCLEMANGGELYFHLNNFAYRFEDVSWITIGQS